MRRAIRTTPVAFDTTMHEYRVGGHRVPSVSDVIKSMNLSPGREWYTDESRDRGRCVHAACMDIDLGVPPRCQHPAHQGFIDSYRLWRDMTLHSYERIEEPRYSDRYGVAGTADRVGIVNRTPAVLDLKTSGVQRWHPIQFALYDLIYDDLPPRVRRRIGLYLREDGRCAKMLPFSDPSDYDRALHALRKLSL